MKALYYTSQKLSRKIPLGKMERGKRLTESALKRVNHATGGMIIPLRKAAVICFAYTKPATLGPSAVPSVTYPRGLLQHRAELRPVIPRRCQKERQLW
jgi:hypothetical protein